MKAGLSLVVLLAAGLSPVLARADFSPSPAFVLSDIPRPYQVALGDLNNDGRTDLVVSAWGPEAKPGESAPATPSRVLIFLQKDGRLAPPADRAFQIVRPWGLLAGDFDADGRTDLAVKDGGKGLHLFLGSESLAVDHLALNTNDSQRQVAAARLGSRGTMDFVSGPVWRRWNGGDRFLNGYCYGPAVNDNGPSVVADLNQDGHPDLVFCGGGKIRIYYGPLTEMNVRADEVSQFVQIATARPAQAIAVGDLNGDGRPDLVAGLYDPQSRSHSVAIYCQQAPLGFGEQPDATIESAGFSAGLQVADLNHDGLADLVLADGSTGRIATFLQRAGGALPGSIEDAYQVLRVRCHSLAIGDVNGDGLPDLAVGDGHTAVRLFLNDGRDEPQRLAAKPGGGHAPAVRQDQETREATGQKTPAVAASPPDAATGQHAERIGNDAPLPPPRPGPDYEDPYRMPFYTGTILPTPQEAAYRDDFFPLDKTGLLLAPGLAADGPLVGQLRERIERYGGKLQVVDSPEAECSTLVLLGELPLADSIRKDRRLPPQPQGYLLLSSRDGLRPAVVLQGRDGLGLLWAVASFNQLVHTRDGRPVVRAADVIDYPHAPQRGFIAGRWSDIAAYCVAFKINKPVLQSALQPGRDPDWRAPLTDDVRRELAAYGRGLTALGITWYAGASPVRGEHTIRSGREEDLQVLLDWACAAEEAGGHLCLKYDDTRFPLSAEDAQQFGSAREADTHALGWLAERLRQRYPQGRILFCPPFYWGPNSPAMYPEPRDEYLFALGRLPPEIELFWTGPSVKSGRVTPEMVGWITERIGRKPLYWQNGFGAPHMFLYHYVTDPIDVYRDWLYDGFLDQVDTYMFNCSMPAYAAAVATCADYCWNPGAYDPQRSIREAVVKLVGEETYPALTALNRALSYFDPFGLRRTPGAAQKLPEMGPRLAAVQSAWGEVQRRNARAVAQWTGMQRHVDQVARFYDQLRRSPNLAAYRQDAAESQRQAQQETGFAEKTDTFLSAYDFVGGAGPAFYANRCERRVATWIYCRQTVNFQLESRFTVEPFPPSGDYELIVSGQDDEAEAACRIRIAVNEQSVFEGPNPLVRFGWSRHTFRIPAAALERQNRLRIENLEEQGRAGGPPFFMLNYAVVRPSAGEPRSKP